MWNMTYNFPSSYSYQIDSSGSSTTYYLSAFGQAVTEGLYSTFIIFGFNEKIKQESNVYIMNLTSHPIRVYGANIDGTNVTQFNNGNSIPCKSQACATWSETHVTYSDIDGGSNYTDDSLIDELLDADVGE